MVYYKSLLYYFNNDLRNSTRVALDYLEKFKYNKDKQITGLVYNLLGTIKVRNDDYKQAIKYYLEATVVFDKVEQRQFLLYTYSEVSFLYLYFDESDLAIKYSNMSIFDNDLSMIKDLQSVAILQSNAAVVNANVGNFDRSFELLKKSNVIFSNIKNQVYALTNSNREAELYYLSQKYEKCILLSKKVLCDNNKNSDIETIAFYNLGRCYLKSLDFAKAVFYLEKVNKNFKKTSFLEIDKGAVLKTVSRAYKLTGDSLNYYKAEMTYLKFINKKLKLNQRSDVSYFNEYRNKIKTQKLEADLNKNAAELKLKNLIIFVIILIIIFIIISTIVLYGNYIKKNKLNKEILIVSNQVKLFNEELETTQLSLNKLIIAKDVLLQEIHHRVKNNLQLIISLLNLQLDKGNDVYDVIEKSQLRILSIALVHENLYNSENLNTIYFKKFIIQLIKNIDGINHTEKVNIEYSYNILDTFFDIDTMIPLGLIINELISNIYKHANLGKNGEVAFKLMEKEKHVFELIVIDNGIGYKVFNKKESLGLELVNALALQLNGCFTVMSSEKGTISTLIFKLDK